MQKEIKTAIECTEIVLKINNYSESFPSKTYTLQEACALLKNDQTHSTSVYILSKHLDITSKYVKIKSIYLKFIMNYVCCVYYSGIIKGSDNIFIDLKR